MRRGREEIPVMKKVFRRIRSSGGGRTLALVLSGALLLSTTGLGVYAADLDGSRNGEGGVVLSYKWPDESGIKWLDEDGSWTMTVPVEEDGAFNWGYVHDQLPQSIIAQVQPPQEDPKEETNGGESLASQATSANQRILPFVALGVVAALLLGLVAFLWWWNLPAQQFSY